MREHLSWYCNSSRRLLGIGWWIKNKEKLRHSGNNSEKKLTKGNGSDGLTMGGKEHGRIKNGINVPNICQWNFKDKQGEMWNR